MAFALSTKMPVRPSRFSATYDPRARRHRPPGPAAPMGSMNVTPFIDVLLVLLIMIILAVPIKVHQTTVDLPTTDPCPECVLNAAKNTVFVDGSDRLFWNGTLVSRDQLRVQVAAASALESEPLLRFEPAPLASYNASAHAITLIKESGAERFAFIGNERHRALD